MKRTMNYRELDEYIWEQEHGCVEEPYGDECWDEVCAREMYEDAQYDDPVEDDETGPGIFGNELNHEQNANDGGNPSVSNGKLYGHGEKDDIISMIFDLLVPFKDYHFEFGFFEAK